MRHPTTVTELVRGRTRIQTYEYLLFTLHRLLLPVVFPARGVLCVSVNSQSIYSSSQSWYLSFSVQSLISPHWASLNLFCLP